MTMFSRTRFPAWPADARPLLRVAMLSYHTCPLAMLGGTKTGGMNVYVRDLSRALAAVGVAVDVFTRSQDDCAPRVVHDLGPLARVMHIPAGPERPMAVGDTEPYLGEFVAMTLVLPNEITLDGMPETDFPIPVQNGVRVAESGDGQIECGRGVRDHDPRAAGGVEGQ